MSSQHFSPPIFQLVCGIDNLWTAVKWIYTCVFGASSLCVSICFDIFRSRRRWSPVYFRFGGIFFPLVRLRMSFHCFLCARRSTHKSICISLRWQITQKTKELTGISSNSNNNQQLFRSEIDEFVMSSWIPFDSIPNWLTSLHVNADCDECHESIRSAFHWKEEKEDEGEREQYCWNWIYRNE